MIRTECWLIDSQVQSPRQSFTSTRHSVRSLDEPHKSSQATRRRTRCVTRRAQSRVTPSNSFALSDANVINVRVLNINPILDSIPYQFTQLLQQLDTSCFTSVRG